MTKPSDLRELDDEELMTRLAEARQELFNLRFQHVTGQLPSPARLAEMRKDVARINTLLRERELDAAEALEGAGVTSATAGTAGTTGAGEDDRG